MQCSIEFILVLILNWSGYCPWAICTKEKKRKEKLCSASIPSFGTKPSFCITLANSGLGQITDYAVADNASLRIAVASLCLTNDLATSVYARRMIESFLSIQGSKNMGCLDGFECSAPDTGTINLLDKIQ